MPPCVGGGRAYPDENGRALSNVGADTFCMERNGGHGRRSRGAPHHKFTVTMTKAEHARFLIAASHAGVTLGGFVARSVDAYVQTHDLRLPAHAQYPDDDKEEA